MCKSTTNDSTPQGETLKLQYHQAYSALRWIATYSPDWDYWSRNYPRFDESRDGTKELLSLSPAAVGAAWQSQELAWRRTLLDYEPNRFLKKYEQKKQKADSQWVMVRPALWAEAKAALDAARQDEGGAR